MVKAFKISLALLLFAVFTNKAGAQEVSVVGAKGAFVDSELMNTVIDGSRFYNIYDIRLGWQFKGDDFAPMYNDPRAGIGISFADIGSMDFKAGTRLGNTFSIYGFFQRDLLRSGRFSAGYTINLGGTMMNHPYHRFDNAKNVMYGGKFTFLITIGLHGMFDAGDGWSLGAEVAGRHHSSGRLIIPNRGLNSASLSLVARYALGDRPVKFNNERLGDNSLVINKKIRFGVFAAGGFHKCMADMYADWELPAEQQKSHYKAYFKGSVGAEAFWRYSRKTATGAGLELHYLSNMKILKESDKTLFGSEGKSYCAFAPGVMVLQEVYYGNLALHFGIGHYLYKGMGIHEDHGWLYQKIGFRYYSPVINGGFIGFNLRAHEFMRADYFDFYVGFAF